MKRKIKRNVAAFKSGYSAGRRPKRTKLMNAADTALNLGGVAAGGPLGVALGLAGVGSQLSSISRNRSKAGKAGRKVGSAVRTAKQKAALKKAQAASALKRKKKK
jgi:hypothetical protein